MIYLSHIPSSFLLCGGAGHAKTCSTSLRALALALTLCLAQEPSPACARNDRTHSPAPPAVRGSSAQMIGQRCRSRWQTSRCCWSVPAESVLRRDLIVFLICFFCAVVDLFLLSEPPFFYTHSQILYTMILSFSL